MTEKSPHTQLRDAFKNNPQYHRILFEQSPIGLALCRMNGELVDVNPAYANILGRSVEETLQLSYWDITPETYAEAEQQQLQNLESNGQYGPYEKHYIHKSGRPVPVRLSGQIIHLDDEVLIWSCVEDISDKKNAESQLEKRTEQLLRQISENEQTENSLRFGDAKYRAIFESAVDGIITISENGLIDSFNPGAEQMFGYEAREVIGQNIAILMPEPYESLHDSYMQNYLASGQAKIIGKGREVKGKHKNGNVFDIYLAVNDVAVAGKRLFTGIVSDITNLKRTQAALQQSEERFRRSQRFANIGTWDWNIQTGELYWSDRIASLFGYQEGELETTYQNFLNAIHPVDRQYVVDAVNACVERGAEYNIEHRCVWPSGEVRWMLERGDVIREENGKALRMLGVVQDITARKQAELDLQIAKEEAERANQAKSEFLSSMSHELRTPLNAVLGFAQLLEYDDQLNPNQKESVVEIQHAGNHLLELISEVLDLAKIEAGRLDLSLEPVSISKILEECCTLTQPIASTKGIKMHCIGQSRKSEPGSNFEQVNDKYVFADNFRLKQVLLNLLSNAVKYNRNNGLVTVQCQDMPSGRLRITVKDTGYGIPQEKLSQLFQPFNRLGAESGNIEGTGIGLVITKRLVNMMNGEMGVESAYGYGSTFWIELPHISHDAQSTENPGAVNAAPKVLSNKKPLPTPPKGTILVVEDNRTNRIILENQLNILGYAAELASDAAQGFELWKNNHYTAILTDINMPDIDGMEFTKMIRKAEQNCAGRIPIIAITAKALQGDAQQCLSAGMDDYIAKPVDLNTLNEVLNKWSALAPSQDTATASQHSAEETPAVDINVLRNLVGDNAAIHADVLQSFADNSEEIVKAIHEAYQANCAQDIVWSSHKLKSSSLAIGAANLSAVCEALEIAAKQNLWQDITTAYQKLDTMYKSVMAFIDEYQPPYAGNMQQDANVSVYHPIYVRVNLLAVDDDLFILKQIADLVKQLGIVSPRTASSGKQALHILDNQHPGDSDTRINIILCDLNMPGMDGIEFLRHLAQRHYSGGVILISGEDSRVLNAAEKLAKAHNLQILGTLRKPVSALQLHTLITKLTLQEQTTAVAEQMLSAQELTDGIEQGQVTVYYQPIIDITTGNAVAVEALARWRHPYRGILGPNTFIPVAENHRLIDALTVEVFSQAVQQAKSWKDAGLELKIAINLSMDTLKHLELPERFISHIDKSGLEYKQIGFEVTESRLMHDITTSLEILTRLNLKGITLSIDDFGTGYSTLEQLQRIPFSELKVDRQFVSGAVLDSSNRAILESSVELAKKLNMTVVAEGVETEEQFELVTSIHCDYIQGYYVAPPMPGGEVLAWAKQWQQSNQLRRLLKKTGS